MPRDLLNAPSLKARLAKAIDEATETHKTGHEYMPGRGASGGLAGA